MLLLCESIHIARISLTRNVVKPIFDAVARCAVLCAVFEFAAQHLFATFLEIPGQDPGGGALVSFMVYPPYFCIARSATRPRPVPRLIGCQICTILDDIAARLRCLTPAEGGRVDKCPACSRSADGRRDPAQVLFVWLPVMRSYAAVRS